MLNLMCIPASMFSNEKEEDLQPVRVQLLISLLPVKLENFRLANMEFSLTKSTISGFHLSIPTIHLPPEAFRGSSQSGKIPS